MRLSVPIPTSLALLLLPFQTFSSPAPNPIPGTLATQNGPVTIPTLSLGAAVSNLQGSTRVYYQATDGSLHELVGTGSPSQRSVYLDQTLLPPGKLRIGTPITADDFGNNLQIHLYFISPDDRLREYYFDRTWRDGNLNAANITTRTGSRYLWTLVQPGPGPKTPRVGYVAPNGDLSEVAFDGETWNRYVY